MAGLKAWAKRHWPQLRLRTILMLTLLFVAGLPGVGAIWLANRSVLSPAARPTTCSRSACASTTESALRPMEPVEPRMEMPFIQTKTKNKITTLAAAFSAS